MESELWIPREERIDLMVQLGVQISQLEEDLYYADNDRMRALVHAELSRKRVEMYRLKAMGDEPPAPVRKPRPKSYKTFYWFAFGLLGMFVFTGAMVAACIMVVIILINYFTSEPPKPEDATLSREVVKE
jgi:hypothetical protein